MKEQEEKKESKSKYNLDKHKVLKQRVEIENLME